MVLSPLSSDCSSFSPVAGCFSLVLLSVNNDNTKRYCEMYMYKYKFSPGHFLEKESEYDTITQTYCASCKACGNGLI